jgi:hypothetical protein
LFSGLGYVTDIGQLLLRGDDEVIIPDLRLTKIVSNVKQRYVELIVNPPQNGCTRVIITPTSDQDFYKWTGILLLWSNLKTEGLEYKISVPSLDFFPGEENLLVCHFKVYFPMVKPKTQRKPSSSASALFTKTSKSLSASPSARDLADNKSDGSGSIGNLSTSSSTNNVSTLSLANDNTSPSPFCTDVYWQPVVGVLNQAGILELLNESDGSIIQSINLQQILSSRIRQIDHSLFDCPRVLYVQPSEGITSCSLPKARSQSDYYFYVYFGNQVDYDDWFTTLKSFTRKRIFSPTSLNISKSLRICRKIGLRIIECKYEKKSPRTNTNINNSPFSNAYVDIEFEKLAWARTFVAYNQKRPFWRDDFVFEDFPVRPPNLKLVVKNRLGTATQSRLNPKFDPVVGYVVISALELRESDNVEKWYPLVPGKDQKGAEYCSICIRINYEEIDILASEHYERIRQVLTADLTNNLTTQIADRIRDLNQLSDILLNLFQAENKCVEWIASLVGGELAKMKDTITNAPVYDTADFRYELDNTLFRGNSLVSKVLERYMKLAGRDYLDKVIGDFVRRAMDTNLAIEIDPSRIPPSSSVSGKPPELIAEINHRRLGRYVGQLWSAIRDTADELPYSFKIIFKRLRVDMAGSLQQDESVIFNAISGFIFLRFFCPALLNPKLFGLVRGHPNNYVQRTFTLIAKMLQGLANRVRFGLKEPWMCPMNSFIDAHEDEMFRYYREISLMNQTEIAGYPTQFDRPIKEQPVPSIMGETPSNPFLIDRYESYARLLKLWTESEAIREDSAISGDGMYDDDDDEDQQSKQQGEDVDEDEEGDLFDECEDNYDAGSDAMLPPQLGRPLSTDSGSSRFEESVMEVLEDRSNSLAPSKRSSSLRHSTTQPSIMTASGRREGNHHKKNTLVQIQEEALDTFELEMVATQHRLDNVKNSLLGPENVEEEDIEDIISYTYITYNSETGHITHSKYALAVAQAASEQQQFTGSPKPSQPKPDSEQQSPIAAPSSPSTPTNTTMNTTTASSPFLNKTGSTFDTTVDELGAELTEEDALSTKSNGHRLTKWMKFKRR